MRPTPIPDTAFSLLPVTTQSLHSTDTPSPYSAWTLWRILTLLTSPLSLKPLFSLEFSDNTLSLGFVLFYPPISQTFWPNSISQQLLLVAYGSFLDPITHSSWKQFQYVFYQNFVKVDNLSHRQNNELRPLPHPIHKNELKIDQSPQCNSKTIKQNKT